MKNVKMCFSLSGSSCRKLNSAAGLRLPHQANDDVLEIQLFSTLKKTVDSGKGENVEGRGKGESKWNQRLRKTLYDAFCQFSQTMVYCAMQQSE